MVEIALGGLAEQEVPRSGGGVCFGKGARAERGFKGPKGFKGFKGLKGLKKRR